MSTEMTWKEGWAIQMAYHEAMGTVPPTELDAETETTLREILGDAAVEAIKDETKR